ncbi:hypothetical protein AB833_27545 [Chromatiales bacterium (ex Bugula neritina AB1)]|nr:hypothetical protein AB833_27545 [Chromatiales bacterium (ex Bugula neritina AB1)]
MNRLTTSHKIEVAFWLLLAGFFFYHSFEFNKEIEIYKYGATLWPRTILLLITLAAIGQFLDQRKNGDQASSNTMAAAHEDSAQETEFGGLRWYTNTFILLAIPFAYMNLSALLSLPVIAALLPEGFNTTLSVDDPNSGRVKIIFAAILFIAYLAIGWRNHVGAILALPILFATLMEDFGFYSLAPVFIIGIMILMGERRVSRMALVMPLIYGILLAFFVSLLYVGLPTGNVNPFYTFGNWIVTLLQ